MKRTSDYTYDSDSDTWVIHPVRLNPEAPDRQVYQPKQTTCLRCGEIFDSFDPRYNRRCEACSKTVRGQPDHYNY